MSALNFFANCIIVALGFRGIFAVPAANTDSFAGNMSTTNLTVKSMPTTNWTARNLSLDSLHTRNSIVHGICACNPGMPGMPARDDYHHTPGIGAHKLHTRAAAWNNARKLCIEEGGHLAIINSIAEARILLDIFSRSGPLKGATDWDTAFLGLHDLYSEGDWVTVLGDSLVKTGYTTWSDKWDGQPDNYGGQHCGALLKEGGMDDVDCSLPLAFFCELSAIQPL